MVFINNSEMGKCVSCEKKMKFGELPSHIAKEHVGYFPYRCLGCELKATPGDFDLVLLHCVETKHQYTVKTRLEMERLITDTLRICVEEAAAVTRIKLEPGINYEQSVPVEIEDIIPGEPSMATAGQATSKHMEQLDILPSPGTRFVVEKEAPLPDQPSSSPTASSQPTGSAGKKRATAKKQGEPKKRATRSRTLRKKEMANIVREMPNPPNSPEHLLVQQTGELAPITAKEGDDTSISRPPQSLQLASPQVELGMAKKRKAIHDAEGEKDSTKRRLPESEMPTVHVGITSQASSSKKNEVESGYCGGFKKLLSKARQPTAPSQHLFSALHFWMLETFGRVYSEGDISASTNAHLEAILRWTKVKDKSKWERMAVDHAARRSINQSGTD